MLRATPADSVVASPMPNMTTPGKTLMSVPGAAIRAAALRTACVLRTSTTNNATTAQTQRRIKVCWNHP